MEEFVKSLRKWLEDLSEMEEKGIEEKEVLGKTSGPMGSEIVYDYSLKPGIEKIKAGRNLLKVKRRGRKTFVLGELPAGAELESTEREGKKFKIFLKVGEEKLEKELQIKPPLQVKRCEIKDHVLIILLEPPLKERISGRLKEVFRR